MTLPSPVQFIVNEPVDTDTKARNIAYALSLGLPEADKRDLAHMNIIANGPSARGVDLKALQGPTAAVNGAISLFLRQGLTPTFWACCDAQPLCADFLPDEPPKDIIYLIASKCDRSVFDKLINAGCEVRLWHIRDHDLVKPYRAVKCASSVTLTLITLFRQIGFRSFRVIGWDTCYSDDGFHHATEPKENFREATMIQLVVGAEQDESGQMIAGSGRTFTTNTTWALEAQDAVQQLHHRDYLITIDGDGLVKAMTGL